MSVWHIREMNVSKISDIKPNVREKLLDGYVELSKNGLGRFIRAIVCSFRSMSISGPMWESWCSDSCMAFPYSLSNSYVWTNFSPSFSKLCSSRGSPSPSHKIFELQIIWSILTKGGVDRRQKHWGSKRSPPYDKLRGNCDWINHFFSRRDAPLQVSGPNTTSSPHQNIIVWTRAPSCIIVQAVKELFEKLFKTEYWASTVYNSELEPLLISHTRVQFISNGCKNLK